MVITIDQVQMREPERNFSYNKNVLKIQFDVYIFANPKQPMTGVTPKCLSF